MWPIISWQKEGEKVEVVTDFLFLGSKITADGDCSHEIRRWLFPGRKAMTNLDSVLKSRDITLSTKVHIVKAMVFPVVTCTCESWTIRKAENQRIYDYIFCVIFHYFMSMTVQQLIIIWVFSWEQVSSCFILPSCLKANSMQAYCKDWTY